MFGQQLRPEWERSLSETERDMLDQQRARREQDIRSHPAIWQKLCELDAKLNTIMKLLSE